jgi:Domain of unknown function (DUF4351)
LDFKFNTVKLLDYRERMAELDASKNPFAMVVKAHLKLQETKKDNQSRKVWKMRLIRQLYEEGYNQDQVLNLFRFIDWVLVLPKQLEAQFWLDLKAYEEERKMPYITSVERIGYDRGVEEADQRALELERSKVLRRLNRKVGSVTESTCERINILSIDQLESLGDALLDFESMADLMAWLDNEK